MFVVAVAARVGLVCQAIGQESSQTRLKREATAPHAHVLWSLTQVLQLRRDLAWHTIHLHFLAAVSSMFEQVAAWQYLFVSAI